VPHVPKILVMDQSNCSFWEKKRKKKSVGAHHSVIKEVRKRRKNVLSLEMI